MKRPRPLGPTTCRELQLLLAASAHVITAPGRPVHVWKRVRVSMIAVRRDGFACTYLNKLENPSDAGHLSETNVEQI